MFFLLQYVIALMIVLSMPLNTNWLAIFWVEPFGRSGKPWHILARSFSSFAASTIPGTTKLHRLRENIGAVSLQLTPEDLRELENAASKIHVQGARYPEHLQKLVGR